ncbi:MAG TPA: lecithin retinol acyltransferase family protein [Steroidobacteraceae bacterium]|nr:lecithin retinol acyltransferase family protein [Steroidobacteraceae bacterium]
MQSTNYSRVCSERRSVRALARGEEPAIGAHLLTPWLGFTHHGIYVGDGRIVHYGALVYDIIRRPVEEVTLEAFAQGRPLFVVEHTHVCFDAAQVVRRARSRLGENRYRLFTNNCEHFVEWCLHGTARSFQAETALAYPRLVAARIELGLLRLAAKLLPPIRRLAGARMPASVSAEPSRGLPDERRPIAGGSVRDP